MIFKALSTTSSIDFIWKRVVIHEFVTTQEARKSKNGSSNGANKIIVPAEGSHPMYASCFFHFNFSFI